MAKSKKESESKVPLDLKKSLASARKAKVQWNDLTPLARKDFIIWIDGAKELDTRKRRINKACSILAQGKRRPCCFTIIPADFYKALAANAKAKAGWKNLGPEKRRDLVIWIDSAKESDAHKKRVEKACEMLASGKQIKKAL